MSKERRHATDPSAIDRLIKAFEECSATGKSSIVCDACGTTIEFKRLGETAYESRCNCEKFNEIFRGL
jgi:hypothetical protein